MSFNQGLFSKSVISITRQEEPLITQFTSTFINKMDVLTKVVMDNRDGIVRKQCLEMRRRMCFCLLCLTQSPDFTYRRVSYAIMRCHCKNKYIFIDCFMFSQMYKKILISRISRQK